MARETFKSEETLKNLLNLLDDAFDGIDFTEEIKKFEEKYKKQAGSHISAQILHLPCWIGRHRFENPF